MRRGLARDQSLSKKAAQKTTSKFHFLLKGKVKNNPVNIIAHRP